MCFMAPRVYLKNRRFYLIPKNYFRYFLPSSFAMPEDKKRKGASLEEMEVDAIFGPSDSSTKSASPQDDRDTSIILQMYNLTISSVQCPILQISLLQ